MQTGGLFGGTKPFGAATTSASPFSFNQPAQQPAFGATTATAGGGLFGKPTGFGAPAASSAFGTTGFGTSELFCATQAELSAGVGRHFLLVEGGGGG